MKRKRFREDQIVKALKEAEGGRATKDICRELGISHPHSSLGGVSPHQYIHDKGNDSSDNVKAKMNDSLQSSSLTLSPQSIESHLRDIEGKTIFE